MTRRDNHAHPLRRRWRDLVGRVLGPLARAGRMVADRDALLVIAPRELERMRSPLPAGRSGAPVNGFKSLR